MTDPSDKVLLETLVSSTARLVELRSFAFVADQLARTNGEGEPDVPAAVTSAREEVAGILEQLAGALRQQSEAVNDPA